MLHLSDQGTDDPVGVFALDLDKHDKSGLPLNQGGDVAILPAGAALHQRRTARGGPTAAGGSVVADTGRFSARQHTGRYRRRADWRQRRPRPRGIAGGEIWGIGRDLLCDNDHGRFIPVWRLEEAMRYGLQGFVQFLDKLGLPPPYDVEFVVALRDFRW